MPQDGLFLRRIVFKLCYCAAYYRLLSEAAFSLRASRITMDQLPPLPGSSASVSVCLVDSNVLRRSARVAELNRVLDALGAASGVAQNLPTAITSAARTAGDPAQRVYVAIDASSFRPLGLLKVGQRTLFVTLPAAAAHSRMCDPSAFVTSLSSSASASSLAQNRAAVRRATGGAGSMWEIQPLCILDFFVSEASRRRGIGRILFDCMMRVEGVSSPSVLAYVRESSRDWILVAYAKTDALPSPLLY